MVNHITIGDISPRVQYVADGAQTIYPYSFSVFQDVDMDVYLADVKQNAGFTVSGAGTSGGGNVTFITAPASGVTVTLRRNIAIQRTTDFQENGEFRAKVINDELDYQIAALQQVSEEAGRAVQISPTQPVGFDGTLPPPLANAVLTYNPTATGFANGPVAADISSAQTYAANAAASEANAASLSATASGAAISAASSASIAAQAVAGGLYSAVQDKAANYTILEADAGDLFRVDTSAGAVTLTVPQISTLAAPEGFKLAATKWTGDVNTVTILASGTDTINGAATQSISNQYEVYAFIADSQTNTWTMIQHGAPIADGSVTTLKLSNAAKPADVPFSAGFGPNGISVDLAVQEYHHLVVARSVVVEGEVGYLNTPSTGAAVVVDILQNGVSIYSVKPQFAAGANTLTAGVLATTTFAAGDRITFSVTQVGSIVAGSGQRLTLKARLA